MDELRVGSWRVEPQLNRISTGDTVLQLEPRVIDLLAFLATRPGEVVSKRELLDRVWGDVHVTEGVLKRAVWELRRALGDDARKPRWIETVPRRGYRLIDAPKPDLPTPDAPALGVPAPDAPAPPAGRRGMARSSRNALGALATVVLVSLLAGFAAWQRPAVEPAVARPVTALEGRELHPALSADGSRLAFAWNGGRGDDFDLYIKLLGSEHLERLTRHPGVDSRPVWSPDGNHLAFVRQAADPAQSGVFVVSVLGGPPRRLLDARQGQITGLAGSPRGDQLAVGLAPDGEASALHLLSLDDRDLRPLTDPPAGAAGDRDPVFSPDGRSIAFVRASSWQDQDVFRVEIDSGRETRLTSDHASVLGLAWTDDGADVVYASDRRGPRSLWRVSADGGKPEWLPASGSDVLHPATDRSGRRLVFEQMRCDTNIRRVASAPDALETVIASTRRDQFPQLSPNGQSLAFVSTRGGGSQVYIAAADGSSVRRLTDLDEPQATTLRWSPDSTRIAFEAWHQGHGEVYVADVASGRVRRLADSPQLKATPGWSADGERVYFGSPDTGGWQIWAAPADGGVPRQVTTGGGRAAVESSEGQLLYYTKHRTPGIWRQPVAGGAEELVVSDFDRDNGVDWILADDGIYYLAERQGQAGVAFFEFASTETSLRFPLARLPHYGGPTLAADRRSVLLTHVARIDGDVMLLDRSG